MFLNTLRKTRWRIESDRVVVYPFGMFYILAVVFAVIFGGLVAYYVTYEHAILSESVPLMIFLFLPVIFLWASGGTYLEFNNREGRMRKMLMGFLPVNNLPFKSIQGINVVSNMAGGYNYRVFRKDAKYGKGLVVSSGYGKNDDPNAIAFVEQAVPVIHGYLDLHDSPADFVVEPITSFKFFNYDQGAYTVKTRKAWGILFGLFFIGLGVWLLTIPAKSVGGTLLMSGFMFVLGLIFINAAFTNTIINMETKTVERKGVLGFLNKTYHLNNFAGIQTVRQSVNFIYTGTQINMHFTIPGNDKKMDVLTVGTQKRNKHIERFVREVYEIIDK